MALYSLYKLFIYIGYTVPFTLHGSRWKIQNRSIIKHNNNNAAQQDISRFSYLPEQPPTG